MPGVLRILDANANRAREAMRVMEDAARFALDDARLTRELKRLRHDLAAALRELPPGALTAARDTPGDTGTTIATESEARRVSLHDVAVAAGKRCSEALRCLEEYGKLIDAAFAARIEQIRYRGYELERRLCEALAPPLARQWKLCVIVSQSLCTHHGWDTVAEQAIDAGAECVQLREKSLGDSDLLDRASRLVEIACGRATIIVNDRPDVAQLAGAGGVHLGAHDLPIGAVRRLVGRSLVIGASTHSQAEAKRAIDAGADYCGVGAIFATATKPRRPAGLAYLRRFIAAHPGVPHLAIGGIGPENIGEVVAAGAGGVAVSSAVCGAASPGKVVRRLLRAMR